jgi:hypothetical protein
MGAVLAASAAAAGRACSEDLFEADKHIRTITNAHEKTLAVALYLAHVLLPQEQLERVTLAHMVGVESSKCSANSPTCCASMPMRCSSSA